jgi:phenylalanyl-tRNA synthetase alpha chain
VVGKLLNEARTSVTAAITERAERLRAEKEAKELANVDISLPGTVAELGSLHPLTQMLDRAISIFRRMGFALAEGPDVETEWHCFDALNTAPDHPARNEQDTFFLPDGRLLRTHTSTVQIRAMEKAPPPIRIIAPGAAYRRDEVDATHSAQFHQIEGLYIDEKVSVADLKGTLEFFLRELFGADTQIRFRPHYFPFTEPSLEVDVKSKALRGGEQWLEMCGCGMVHPAVYEQVNSARGDNAYDPGKWSGFAFGLGMDRLAMILFGIPDLRYFAANDLRFLRQFA